MNKLFLAISAVFVIMVSYESCKKELPPTNPTPHQAKLLVSVLKIYESRDSDIIAYSYDDSNRVVKKVEAFDKSPLATFAYTYDSNNNLVQLTYSIAGGYTNVFSIIYLNNQPDHVNSYATVGPNISFNGLYCSYTVQNNKIVKNESYDGNRSYWNYQGNNIIFSATKYSPSQNATPDTVSTSYQYGSKNGPFKYLRLNQWVLALPGEFGGEDIEYDQNDLVSYTRSNLQDTVKLQIQYNDQNYPTRVVYGNTGITNAYTYINAK